MLEDRLIRSYCHEKYAAAGIVTIKIERYVDHMRVYLEVARPNVLAGSRGQDLETTRQRLVHEIVQFRKKKWSARQLAETSELHLTLHVAKIETPNTSAALLANDLAEQLEKRIPFRRAMKTVLQRAEREKIPGIKIQVSGRLNGAEIARTEWIRKGRVPLHTLQAKIDYRARTAKTIYGLLGIKIWLYKGMTNELSVHS
jgi:small subunit ribosomal protein S3